MSDSSPRTFTADFRRFFLRGLVVLLPSVLTLWIVVKAYQFIDNTIAEPVNRGVRITLVNVARVWSPLNDFFEPTELEIERGLEEIPPAKRVDNSREIVRRQLLADNLEKWWQSHWYMDLIGLFVAIIAVYIAGRLVGGFLGRSTYRRLERFITTLPIFKQVYPYVKQVVDFLFSDDQPIKFNRVVAVEYPRKGIWAVGFATGSPMRSITQRAGQSLTIFIPSSPTPFTGYTITVPIDDVVDLPITVEEAMRYAVTGGVLIPDHQSRGHSLPSPEISSSRKPAGSIKIDNPPLKEETTPSNTSGTDETPDAQAKPRGTD